MTLWIKICGMTTPEAVDASIEARVDAIGFVFAESVRRLTPAAAASLAQPARGRVACVAVTRHPAQELIDDIVRVFKPDLLQTDAADLSGLRLPRELTVLPVLRQWSETPPSRLLYEGPSSGTGQTCDWDSARRMARTSELILAGGLNAANVADAIGAVHPFGVDVSSGVEERPGIKSRMRIEQFTEAVRSAGSAIKETT